MPDESIVQKLTTVVQADVEAVEQALGRERASSFTAQLAERDQERDDAFVALRDFAKASSSRGKSEVAKAGELIYRIFQRRGLTLYRLGYMQQSAALNLLFEDLSMPAAQNSLEVLQAVSWLDDLRTAHEAFEQTYSEKVSSEARQDYPLLRAARLRLGRHVETLLGCLEVLQRFVEQDGTEAELATLSQLTGKVNEIITEVMTVARARRTRESNSLSSQDTDQEALAATAS